MTYALSQSVAFQGPIPPIDIVVTWVDGSCDDFRRKRDSFISSEYSASYSSEEVDGSRYEPGNDLTLCLCSIGKFADFARRIFIITDGQLPDFSMLKSLGYSDLLEKVRLVDHKVIFQGYEEFLPVFNSLSIETMLHRIPGLSEYYIYLNDDFLFLRPVHPADFFSYGRLSISGYLASITSAAIRYDLFKASSSRTVGFVGPMVNASAVAGSLTVIPRLYHSPYVFRKSTLVDFFEQNRSAMLSNIAHRFRSRSQFSTAALASCLELRNNSLVLNPLPRHIYVKPIRTLPGYSVAKRLPYYLFERIIFGCFQNLSVASVQKRKNNETWILNLLQR